MNAGVIALLVAAVVGIAGGLYLVATGDGPGPIVVAMGVMMLVLAGAVRGKAKKKEQD